MTRVLFVMLHPGFIRYYEDAIRALAGEDRHVHVAFEVSGTKLGADVAAARLASSSPYITCGTAPTRAESVRVFLSRGDRTATRSGAADAAGAGRRDRAWESLATTVRLLLDYLRYFEPVFASAGSLRMRAEKRLPRVYRAPVARLARRGRWARAMLSWTLRALERTMPPNRAVEAFLREQRPDVLLVTPLVELGSQQVDYVKCARRLGIPSAVCVASWDNLTSKGLMRVVPDRVIVWNEVQKAEAVALHGARPDQVVVTGAQVFDRWFQARPGRTRDEFCRMIGLDPARPIVLYVGSSVFVAPDEVPFAERWLARLRGAADFTVAEAGVLVRPHPANANQWRLLPPAPGVAVWPPIGTDPTHPDFARDYFDSLYHSAAVVGVNTSAQIEAGIVGRPVLTIRAREFAHSQAGAPHFTHLVREGAALVRAADTLDEHLHQLSDALAGRAPLDEARRFVGSFVRPLGLDVPAVPAFVAAVEALSRQGGSAAPDPWWAAAVRPGVWAVARVAHLLAEDRPLWVYAVRPLITAGVWAAAAVYGVRTAWSGGGRLRVKRARRAAGRLWHQSRRSAGRRLDRASRPVRAVMRGALRRLAGRGA
jgi:hypothetical protein